MSKSMKLSLAMVAAVAVALTAAFAMTRPDPTPTGTAQGEGTSAPLVREDSPRLTTGKDAVLVEFLDFECEACKAVHPVVEDLRREYGDRVTFVVRHMPLHGNSVDAAAAAEAAGEQGQFEQMHDKLFDNADQWGHQQDSQAQVFEGYAKDLGLNMAQFRADVADPKILERIEQSQRDAQAAGVTGTPTFFLDGTKIEPTTVDDFKAALDAAVDS